MPAPAPPVDEPDRLLALHRSGVLTIDPEPLLDDIIALATVVTASPRAEINVMDELVQLQLAAHGDIRQVQRGDALCAHVVAEGRPIHVPDLSVDERFADNPHVTGERATFRLYAGFPLHDRDGYVLGSLCVMDDSSRELDSTQYDSLARLARQTEVLFELHRRTALLGRALEEIDHRARTDALTGLPNRRGLEDLLEHQLDGAAVLFVDLDGFKQVNDARGHLVGDAVLAELARRLTTVVRAGDRVARFGGDEFIVVAHGLTLPEARALGERLREAVEAPLPHDTGTIRMSVSIGLAAAAPGEPALSVVRRADAAMYLDKHARVPLGVAGD